MTLRLHGGFNLTRVCNNSICLQQDEESSSSSDVDDEDWDSDTAESGSGSEDEEGNNAIAKIFLKKSVPVLCTLCVRMELLWIESRVNTTASVTEHSSKSKHPATDFHSLYLTLYVKRYSRAVLGNRQPARNIWPQSDFFRAPQCFLS